MAQKGTRATATADTAKEYLQSDHESVANCKEEGEDENLDIKKRKRDIAEWVVQPRKLPFSNEDKEAEGREEEVGPTQASTEYNSPIN